MDLHPQPGRYPVEVRTSAGTTRVGELKYSASFVQIIASADRALAALEDEGVFAREQQTEYEALTHFDSLAPWREYLESQAEFYVAPDEAMLASIEAALDEAPGEVVLGEWIRETRFRRVGLPNG